MISRSSALSTSVQLAPDELIAVIGPHVGPCCYEVDEPVREAVGEGSALSPSTRAGRYMLDLFALNRLQLLRAGLRADRILRVGGCTCCDATLYASYRRDASSARMLHFVRMPLP